MKKFNYIKQAMIEQGIIAGEDSTAVPPLKQEPEPVKENPFLPEGSSKEDLKNAIVQRVFEKMQEKITQQQQQPQQPTDGGGQEMPPPEQAPQQEGSMTQEEPLPEPNVAPQEESEPLPEPDNVAEPVEQESEANVPSDNTSDLPEDVDNIIDMVKDGKDTSEIVDNIKNDNNQENKDSEEDDYTNSLLFDDEEIGADENKNEGTNEKEGESESGSSDILFGDENGLEELPEENTKQLALQENAPSSDSPVSAENLILEQDSSVTASIKYVKADEEGINLDTVVTEDNLEEVMNHLKHHFVNQDEDTDESEESEEEDEDAEEEVKEKSKSKSKDKKVKEPKNHVLDVVQNLLDTVQLLVETNPTVKTASSIEELADRAIKASFRSLKAKEFDTQEQLDKYLKNHPEANPRNHWVKRDKTKKPSTPGAKPEQKQVSQTPSLQEKPQKAPQPQNNTQKAPETPQVQKPVAPVQKAPVVPPQVPLSKVPEKKEPEKKPETLTPVSEPKKEAPKTKSEKNESSDKPHWFDEKKPVNVGNEEEMKSRGFSKKKVEKLHDDLVFSDAKTGKKYKFKDLPDDVKAQLHKINEEKGIWHSPPKVSDTKPETVKPATPKPENAKPSGLPKMKPLTGPINPPKRVVDQIEKKPETGKDTKQKSLFDKDKKPVIKKTDDNPPFKTFSEKEVNEITDKHKPSHLNEAFKTFNHNNKKHVKEIKPLLKKKPSVREFIDGVMDLFKSKKLKSASVVNKLSMELTEDIIAQRVANSFLKAVKDKDLMSDTGGATKKRPNSPDLKPPRADLRSRYKNKELTKDERDRDIDLDKDLRI